MASSGKIATRSETRHSVFGHPSPLAGGQLPTREDVFRCYLWYREREATELESKTPSSRDISKVVANDVLAIWTKASIPTITYSNVVQSIDRLIDRAKELEKYPPAKRTSSSFHTKEASFKELFDICPCKCVSKGLHDRSNCTCITKVPAIEWEFWIDQNSERKMIIGPVDAEVTAVLQRRQKRKEKEETFIKQSIEKSSDTGVAECATTTSGDEQWMSDSSHDSYSANESDYESEKCSGQNRLQYPSLSRVMERSGISNRDACRIVNACLQDMHLDKPENLVTESKIRRQRIYWRTKEVEDRSATLRHLLCIGFDGRIDETRLWKVGGVPRTEKEDHYVIVSFPGEHYIDHVAPQSGKADDIAAEILSVIHETDSSDSICAILSDSTNVNTGEHNGIIRQLEVALKHPLQWLICMLHLNELPFREVFKIVDGPTSGPSGFKGPVGSELKFDPCHLPIADFKAVRGQMEDMPDEITADLSEDQKYLLRACLTVQQGKDAANPEDIKFLETASPGLLSHARWLTCANRTLRLYMGTENASEELLKLVAFIVLVYAPSWFKIKSHPSCTDGARNFFFIMQACRQLDDSRLCEAVERVLKRNSYFAHPENILLAALTDIDCDIRRDAAIKTTAARTKSKSTTNIRKFSKSSITLNFGADSYYSMIDWSKSTVSSPPLLQSRPRKSFKKQKRIRY